MAMRWLPKEVGVPLIRPTLAMPMPTSTPLLLLTAQLCPSMITKINLIIALRHIIRLLLFLPLRMLIAK